MNDEHESFIAYQAASVRKNWRTAMMGIVLAVSGWIVTHPEGFDAFVLDIARMLFVSGLAGLGLVAKDASVTGTAHKLGSDAAKVLSADGTMLRGDEKTIATGIVGNVCPLCSAEAGTPCASIAGVPWFHRSRLPGGES